MALEDIEKKIINDAERDAKKITTEVEKEQVGRLEVVKQEVAAEKKQLFDKIDHKVKQAVEQRKMLAKLEASQEILKAKRDILDKLRIEVRAEILSEEDLTTAFFKKILGGLGDVLAESKASLEVAAANEKALQKALKALSANIKISSKKKWEPGRLEFVEQRSRIDCSLDLFLKEELEKNEQEIAEKLFT